MADPREHLQGNGWAWIPVSFQSQFETGCLTNNRCCGLASVNMATAYAYGAEPSVDYLNKMREYLGLNNCCNDGIYPHQLLDVAENIGNCHHSATGYFTYDELKQSLNSGIPVVINLKYSEISNKCATFNGFHSVLLIGYNESLQVWTVNDPLCRTVGDGCNKRLASPEFRAACEAYSYSENRAYGIKIMR